MSGVFELRLRSGHTVVVDEQDRPLVESRKWRVADANSSGIAYAYSGTDALHRLIMQPGKGDVVDHVNGNGLDNRRANLRVCAHRENIRNARLLVSAKKRSRFKGVSLHTETGNWQAVIHQNGERLHLGTFGEEEKAARVYDAAAKVFFGRFARTNKDLGLLA